MMADTRQFPAPASASPWDPFLAVMPSFSAAALHPSIARPSPARWVGHTGRDSVALPSCSPFVTVRTGRAPR